MPALPALALAVAFHVVIFGAAILLPRLFDRPPPLRKPIIAHLVALGRPRDPRLLPRKESPPPARRLPLLSRSRRCERHPRLRSPSGASLRGAS